MRQEWVDEYLVILNSGTATDCNFNNILDLNEAGTTSHDNGLADNCECIADINGDDRVDLEDIVTLLFAWGEPRRRTRCCSTWTTTEDLERCDRPFL